MTSSEVTNSSPSVDAATGLGQAARNHDLQRVLERAEGQLRQLTLQRQEIDQRIAIIKRTINGLALIYGAELQGYLGNTDATPKRTRGITNACRVVLTRTDTSLSAHEICAIIQEDFPDLFHKPGNHYASLVAILSRLVKYGQANTFRRNGSRFWQRPQPLDHGSAG